MKYGEVVRDLAARGGNWRFYDTQFRSLRQSNVPGMPWAQPIGSCGFVRKT